MRHKSIFALAVIVVIIFSVFSFIHLIAADESGTTPVLSIVPTGDAGSSVTSYIPQAAIGSQFTVDIRLDNASFVSGGVSGATYAVTWNPSVLKFVSSSDGACWGGNDSAIFADVFPQNNDSCFSFNQIIVNTTNASATIEPYNAVVLGQITFQVVGTGQSNIFFDLSGNNLLYIATPSGQDIGTAQGLITAGAIYAKGASSSNLLESIALFAIPAIIIAVAILLVLTKNKKSKKNRRK